MPHTKFRNLHEAPMNLYGCGSRSDIDAALQENALSLMRRELRNLWDQVASEENGPLSFMTPKQIDIDPISCSVSPVTRVWDAPYRETPMVKTPGALKLQTKSGLSDDSLGSCDSLKDDSVNKSVLLIEGPKDHLQADQPGDAKWFSNPLIEHSEQSEDSTHSEHYFEDCTPEKRQRIFSRFTPDAIEPVEWMSVESSFTPVTSDAIIPLTNRKSFTFEVHYFASFLYAVLMAKYCKPYRICSCGSHVVNGFHLHMRHGIGV